MRLRLSTSFSLSFLALNLFLSFAFATSYPWWGLYPQCAWDSLNAAVPSSCADLIVPTACLCDSQSFLTNAAKGIGKTCGCSILDTCAQTAATICNNYDFPMALTKQQYINAGSPCGATSTSSTIGAQSSPASTDPSNTPSESSGGGGGGGGGGGLSASTVAIISVVSSLVAIAGVVIGVYMKCRKNRKNKKERKLDDYSMRMSGPGYRWP